MTTTLTAIQQPKRLNPRNLEIIRRLILGQDPRQIQEEMRLSPGRFSVIVNSPFFRLVLRQEMLKKAELIAEIQENLLKGANLGTKLNLEVLESPTGTYSTEFKVKVGMMAVNQAMKMLALTSPQNGGNHNEPLRGEEDGESYEERLRKVTFEESRKIVHKVAPPEEISYPPESELREEEEEDVS